MPRGISSCVEPEPRPWSGEPSIPKSTLQIVMLAATVLWPRSVLRPSFACGRRPHALNPRTPLTQFSQYVFPALLFFVQRIAYFFSSASILFPALLFFPVLWQSRLLVCWARAQRLCWTQSPRALNGQGPAESLLVCWARAQGSVGRTPISESTLQIFMVAAAVLWPHSVIRFSFRKAKPKDSAYTVFAFINPSAASFCSALCHLFSSAPSFFQRVFVCSALGHYCLFQRGCSICFSALWQYRLLVCWARAQDP